MNMKFDSIIQKFAQKSDMDSKNRSEIIRNLIELKACLSDEELNNRLLNNLVEKYALVERRLEAVNQKLIESNEQIKTALAEKKIAFDNLDRELAGAADYVKTILPSPVLDGDIRIDWRFRPSSKLGGDAFGYHWLDDESFAMYLIDVSGHGIRPALLSVSIINSLRSHSLPETDFKNPGTVLSALNKVFPSEKNNFMFFTIWYGVYHKSDRELCFASGGHPPALLLNNSDTQNGKINQLRTPNMVIGALEEADFGKQRLQVRKNARLYIYSDGVYEIRKHDGRSMWQLEEFVEYMSTFTIETPDVLDRLIQHTQTLGGSAEFDDDFTVMEITFG